MKILKTKNKRITFEINKTSSRQQTLAFGFGRFSVSDGHYNYKDYLGFGLNLFWIYISLMFMLPKIMQRTVE